MYFLAGLRTFRRLCTKRLTSTELLIQEDVQDNSPIANENHIVRSRCKYRFQLPELRAGIYNNQGWPHGFDQPSHVRILQERLRQSRHGKSLGHYHDLAWYYPSIQFFRAAINQGSIRVLRWNHEEKKSVENSSSIRHSRHNNLFFQIPLIW